MPVCVWCGEKVVALYRVYAGGSLRMTRCPSCGKVADRYVEYDFVSKFLDIILRREEVQRHILFNSHDYGLLTAKTTSPSSTSSPATPGSCAAPTTSESDAQTTASPASVSIPNCLDSRRKGSTTQRVPHSLRRSTADIDFGGEDEVENEVNSNRRRRRRRRLSGKGSGASNGGMGSHRSAGHSDDGNGDSAHTNYSFAEGRWRGSRQTSSASSSEGGGKTKPKEVDRNIHGLTAATHSSLSHRKIVQTGVPPTSSPASSEDDDDDNVVESRSFQPELLKFAAAVVVLDAYAKWKAVTDMLRVSILDDPEAANKGEADRLHAQIANLPDLLVAFPLMLSVVSMLTFILTIAIVAFFLRRCGICRGLARVSVGQVAVAILASTDGRFGCILMSIWDPNLSLREMFGVWNLFANYKCIKVLFRDRKEAAVVCVVLGVMMRTVLQGLLWHVLWPWKCTDRHLLWM